MDLSRPGVFGGDVVPKALARYGIDVDAPDPRVS